MGTAAISAVVYGPAWETWTPSRLTKTFGDRVFSVARHITQNDDIAADVLIETFLEVCCDLEGRGGKELRRRLVTAAAKRALVKLSEQTGDSSEELVAREFLVWGDDYPRHQNKEQLSHALEHGLSILAPMSRAVFVLRDMEQLSMEQIAEIVNRSIPAVEVCLLRARLQLRELLTTQWKVVQ